MLNLYNYTSTWKSKTKYLLLYMPLRARKNVKWSVQSIFAEFIKDWWTNLLQFFRYSAIFTELDAQFTIQVSIGLMAIGPSLLNNERSPWSLSKAKVLRSH